MPLCVQGSKQSLADKLGKLFAMFRVYGFEGVGSRAFVMQVSQFRTKHARLNFEEYFRMVIRPPGKKNYLRPCRS